MDEITERFFKVADHLELKGSDLVKLVDGMTKQRVSNAKTGRNSVPIELIQALSNTYSANANYIITGEGDMFLSDNYTKTVEVRRTIPNSIDLSKMKDSISRVISEADGEDNLKAVASCVYNKENLVYIPYVSISATATFIDSLCDSKFEMETYGVMQEDDEILNEDYMVFQVSGESMEPTIPNGAKILAERIDDGKWENADGVIVIVYGKVLTVKRIKKNALFLDNRLVLKADNPKHGEMEVERREIRGMWKAKRIISQRIV